VKTWSDVKFDHYSIVSRTYRYSPTRGGGSTSQWYAVVDVPNDPNLSNNTSPVRTITASRCGDDEEHDD
jgi:hypothetical protein